MPLNVECGVHVLVPYKYTVTGSVLVQHETQIYTIKGKETINVSWEAPGG